MIRVGIAGMGTMGWFHARRYLQMPNARLVAIADITPSRLEATEAVIGNLPDNSPRADLSTLARYPDASTMIAEAGVDVVDICLPTYLHASHAIEALEAGHDVLCEKPMALGVDQADSMIEAASRTGRKLMIAQCIRFWPEYRYMRRCVEEQPFGELLSLNMRRMGGRPVWSWQNWFNDPARSGGPMYDLHVHDVDFIQAMLGMPDRIEVVGRRLNADGAHEVVHALFDYRGGPQVHVHAGWSNAQIPFHAAFDAWFERGFLRFDSRADPALTVYDDLQRVDGHPAALEPGDAYYNEIAYFLGAVENDTPLAECTPESTRGTLRLIDLEIESIESGHIVLGKE
jgi:predicted dehydrogenase